MAILPNNFHALVDFYEDSIVHTHPCKYPRSEVDLVDILDLSDPFINKICFIILSNPRDQTLKAQLPSYP